MKSRRKFESNPLNKGVLATFAVVLIGFGLLTNYAFQSAFSGSPTADAAEAASSRSSSKSGGSKISIREGSGILSGDSNDHEKIRQTAKDLDQQLMAKLRDRRARDFSASHSDEYFDAQERANRVRQDYKAVKKARHLSKGMKSDFKNHYRNITDDN